MGFIFIIAVALTCISIWVFIRGIGSIWRVVKQGQPLPNRTRPIGKRLGGIAAEVISHLKFTREHWYIAVAHWVVMVSFPLLAATLITAYGQILDPYFTLPVIGHFIPYEWAIEIFASLGILGGVTLTVRRTVLVFKAKYGKNTKTNRFYGSNHWQARFVEFVIIGVLVCVILLRILERQIFLHMSSQDIPSLASWWHFPITGWISASLPIMDINTTKTLITTIAIVKILISLSWILVVGLAPSMGVAWHRFLAFFTIYLRKNVDGRPALGALEPLRVNGKTITLEQLEDLDEDAHLGVLEIKDFNQKNLLDISTCTECGRCQTVCPAWKAGSPLSPKLIVISIQNLAFEMSDQLAVDPECSARSPEALWDCTTCGACVDVCPVDIEHLDIISGLRRGQVLMESAFPKDLNRTFRNLEKNANPFGQTARKRLDWTKQCPVPVPVLGKDVDSIKDVDCLLWVGCAGAFDEHGQKTTRAVAELLTIAGVKFCVLGEAENCTGDAARRSGNELLYQELAQTNIETLNEAGANKKTTILTSCAHCFNSFAREYPELGGTYQVIHHSQMVNRIIREGKLNPVPDPNGSPLTYHDPCYLGRHNDEYDSSRNVLKLSGGKPVIEMSANRQASICCGAGGAHAFYDDGTSSTISKIRANQAVKTGAETVVTGCPFCATMLTNALSTPLESNKEQDVTRTAQPACSLVVNSKLGNSESPSPADLEIVKQPVVKDLALVVLEAVKRGQTNSDTTSISQI